MLHTLGNGHREMRLSALDDLYTLFCRGFGSGRGFGFPENISEVDCAEGIIINFTRLQCVNLQ